MKFTNKARYDTHAMRADLANTLSHIIDAGTSPDELPYQPNKGDDMFWTLDSGNNWKLKFFPDEPEIFEVTYRYNTTQEASLAPWLAERIWAEPV